MSIAVNATHAAPPRAERRPRVAATVGVLAVLLLSPIQASGGLDWSAKVLSDTVADPVACA